MNICRTGKYKELSKEPSRFYQSLEKMAKFRNLIVHSYDNIDSAFIISILRNNLGDFTDFKNSVLEWMSKKK